MHPTVLDIQHLIWDPGNMAHIARHGVTPEEVEEVCAGGFVALQSYHQRLLLIGPTRAGRTLAVVLEPDLQPGGVGVWYPVTARPASRKERSYHRTQMRGG